MRLTTRGRRLLSALCAVATVLLLCLAFPQPAGAFSGAQTYRFSGYDYTQAYPWGQKTETLPYVNATSYYTTTMNTTTLYYHAPNVVCACETQAGIRVLSGQQVGVICYVWDNAGHLFDKIDSRFSGNAAVNWTPSPPITGSNLWIGYVLDDYVNLTYAARINYVPPC